ncbi:head GIN domain-containing protein [Zunongwangia sp. F363]|uniref:Head GIN domain-containing protein n=1 Tax=Autumnicola tepida TaxID=3075595 RepID=A0ABU3C8P4_9FLAO|nr:head GIN domain-containing protein [Zunongwangia sp. F363]MDT0642701.1 head GIN domain-containing protein [Zunongwangia sp. F363]
MKNLLVVLTLLCGSIGLAQEVVHNLDNFEELKVSNGLQITLSKSNVNKAVVTGENREDVEFEVRNGVLKIKKSIDNIWKDEDVHIKVFYTEIHKLSAVQNATIRIQNPVKQGNLELESQEGAEIHANIEVNQLTAKAVTGGEIDVEGTAGHQEISIRAGGKFYGGNLRSRNTNVDISAGGVADINASKQVVAKVRAGGVVNVYGNPEVIDKQTLFGGKVISKN